jgi:hypothetical protein
MSFLDHAVGVMPHLKRSPYFLQYGRRPNLTKGVRLHKSHVQVQDTRKKVVRALAKGSTLGTLDDIRPMFRAAWEHAKI